MFAVFPPAKVTRTQRSPIACWEAEEERGASLLSASVTSSVAPVLASSALGGERVRPSSIAGAQVHVSGVAMHPSSFLSGVGREICWIVDENTRLLRLWCMRKPRWEQTAARVAQIPKFTEDEGLPLFVSELEGESLAFCTDYGTVSSLDHSVEFRFDDDDGAPALVTAFTCHRDQSSILTAVGTANGMLLVAVKAGGERVVVGFTRAESNVSVLSTPLGASRASFWWRWWKPREQSNTGNTRANSDLDYSHRTADMEGAQTEFTIIRFRTEPSARHVWAVSGAPEVLLIDFADWRQSEKMQAVWATNVAAVLQRRCRVVAIEEAAGSLYTLVYLLPSETHDMGLIVVALDVRNGSVRQTLSVESIAALTRTVADAPLHHTRLCVDAAGRMVTILAGRYCVQLNSRVDVRSPCASEDVHLLRRVGRSLGSVLLPDGTIATMDASGPVISVIDDPNDEESAAGQGRDLARTEEDRGRQQRPYASWERSRFAGNPGASSDMARQVSAILESHRLDARDGLDTVVLGASDAIATQCRPHEGNWARTDLCTEDENIVMHVTQNLVRRQQEHRRFVIEVLLHEEIQAQLRPSTIARLLSAQEALLAMVAIRRLQNDGPYPLIPLGASGALSQKDRAEYNDNNEEELGLASGVDLYARHARTAEERDRCERLLREAIVRVADELRATSSSTSDDASNNRNAHSRDAAGTNSINRSSSRALHTLRSVLGDHIVATSVGESGPATAAELVFAEPGRLTLLLDAVLQGLHKRQENVHVNHRHRFDEAVAVATIFAVVTGATKESREDMKHIYAIAPTSRTELWTSSDETCYGVQQILTAMCTAVAEALACAAGVPRVVHQAAVVSPNEQRRLLDFLARLLRFCFANHAENDAPFFARVLRQSLFCGPFLCEPLGYPYGAPQPSPNVAIGPSVLALCEDLALEFAVGDVLMSVSLADVVAEPQREPSRYSRLSAYVAREPSLLRVVCRTLLTQRREMELLQLPELLSPSLYATATAARDAFLSTEAPQLAWLIDPSAFASLAKEGLRWQSPTSYGEDLVTHRARCIAAAKLAWVAAGAPPSRAHYELMLDEAIVTAQRQFLLPEMARAQLGAAELVQRLLEVREPKAWAAAASVACHVDGNTRDDILAQILRRARMHDGDALHHIIENAASEREVAQSLEQTAVGGVVLAAAELRRAADFLRIGESVLDDKEQRLLASWVRVRAAGLVS